MFIKTGVLIKKKYLDTETDMYTGECHGKMKAGFKVKPLEVNEQQRLIENHQKLGQKHGIEAPL